MRAMYRFPGCIVIIAAITIMAGSTLLFPVRVDARDKFLSTTKDIRGIAFYDFWTSVKEEGTKWAGNRLRVRRIISIPVRGFDGRNGRSPAWEAQLILCDNPRGKDTAEEAPMTGQVCKGRSVILSAVESGVSGADAGIHISKEKAFRGQAMRMERIKIGAGQAEETANNYRNYNPVETDTYMYELKFDRRAGRPVWVIKRTCGYRGRSEGRCTPGDHWISKVDAESGEIVK